MKESTKERLIALGLAAVLFAVAVGLAVGCALWARMAVSSP